MIAEKVEHRRLVVAVAEVGDPVRPAQVIQGCHRQRAEERMTAHIGNPAVPRHDDALDVLVADPREEIVLPGRDDVPGTRKLDSESGQLLLIAGDDVA